MSNQTDPQASGTILYGICGTIVFVVVVLLLQTLYYSVNRSEHEAKVVSQSFEELDSVQSRQIENLNAYRWVNKASGVIAIPIDRAIEIVAKESAAAQAAPAPANPTP